MKTLENRLQEYMIDHQLTITEFCDEIGITQFTYRQMKNKKPSIKTYGKLAKALNEPASQIMQYPIKDE